MEIMYKTSATSVGGREGHVRSEDGVLDLELHTPGTMGGPGGSTNPEQLFAAGYAACFNSAMNLVARMERIHIENSKVTAEITLGKDTDGGFTLGARLLVSIPGIEEDVARHLAERAHQVCPYSRATKGNIRSEVVVVTE